MLGLIEPISPDGIAALTNSLNVRAPICVTAAYALAQILQRDSPERLPHFTQMLPDLKKISAANPRESMLAQLIALIERGGQPAGPGPLRRKP